MRHLLPITLLLLSNLLFSQSNIRQADAVYQSKDWSEAYSLYQEITQENPFNGQYWYRLGYAALMEKNYPEANRAFSQATKLMANPSGALYNLACIHALQSNKEKALDFLEKAWWAGFKDANWIKQDQDLESLRQEARFLQLLGQPTTKPSSKVEAWQKDLEFLALQFEQGHPFLFHTISQTEWEHRKQVVKDKIPSLEDYAIVFEFMRLIACIQDGHSNLFPILPGSSTFHYLPIDLTLFKDGLFVKSAKPTLKNLLGAKVLKVGFKTAEELLEESYQYIGADNLMQKQSMFGLITRLSEFYLMTSISEDIAAIPFLFEFENGKQEWISIDGSELSPKYAPTAFDDHIYAADGSAEGHSISSHKFYWYEHQKESSTVYFQYNQVADHPHGESLKTFSERLFKYVQKEHPERLIIDVRNNSGGNNYLNWPIIQGILTTPEINQKGKLFVLMGRNTFSAAMNFVSDMERFTNVIFAGEPSGSSPNNYGEHNGFRLPHSGLSGSHSSRYYQGGVNSNDPRPWVAPDILAIPTYKDFKLGVDPVMEAVLHY